MIRRLNNKFTNIYSWLWSNKFKQKIQKKNGLGTNTQRILFIDSSVAVQVSTHSLKYLWGIIDKRLSFGLHIEHSILREKWQSKLDNCVSVPIHWAFYGMDRWTSSIYGTLLWILFICSFCICCRYNCSPFLFEIANWAAALDSVVCTR